MTRYMRFARKQTACYTTANGALGLQQHCFKIYGKDYFEERGKIMNPAVIVVALVAVAAVGIGAVVKKKKSK